MKLQIRRRKTVEYRWEPTGRKVLIPCPNCGGEYEELRVQPDRSPAYLRQILLCQGCGGIFGWWPSQPKTRR